MTEKHPLHERDFTGSMLDLESCHFVGTTGDAELDQRVLDLAVEIAGEERACLLAEMMVTSIRTAKGTASYANFKMMNRVLKEMRHADDVFHLYNHRRKVAIYGSARTKPDEAEYQAAVKFASRLKELDYMAITGAGPGIMAAGNEGAGREDSFGLNISLPFEASANEFIEGNEKLINFNYFFTRKLSFIKEADAGVAFPGGFGTMDEVFEALTLIQTGKTTIHPIVLVDVPGGEYWKSWEKFVREHLMRLNLISETDFSLFLITEDIDEAIEEITGFYRNFHSYRYIGDQLVIRMLDKLSDDVVETMNVEFKDIVKSGKIHQRGPLEAEKNEPDLSHLPRLVLRHKRRDFGRFRMLINAVNA